MAFRLTHAVWLSLAISAALAAVLAVWQIDRADAGGQARVRLLPVGSVADYRDGTFSVRVDVSNLAHYGRVGYDDDRDGAFDRFEASDGLAAYEVKLRYNPDVVDVIDARMGDMLREAGRNPQCFAQQPDPTNYAIGCVSIGQDEGAQGSGRLVTFNIRPIANGMSYLAIEATLSGPLGDPISARVDGGVVEVRRAPADADDPDETDDPPRGNNNSNSGNNGNNGSNGNGNGNGNSGNTNDPSNPNGNGVTLPGNNVNADGEVMIDTDGDGIPDTVVSAGTGFELPESSWPMAAAGALMALTGALFLLSARFAFARSD